MKKLTTISWVRNEADIIEAFVRHHARIADRMIVIDHRSRDGTANILGQLRDEGLPLEIRHEDSPHHRQAGALTELLHDTAGDSEWILPLDADEFLGAADDPRSMIDRLPQDAIHVLPWRTYVPTAADDEAEPHVLRRITHRRLQEPAANTKILIPCALIRNTDVALVLGSHELIDVTSGMTLPAHASDALFLAHFPVRSAMQLRRKVMAGWLSHCADPGKLPGQIYQWKGLFRRCADPRPVDAMELQRIALLYANGPRIDPAADIPIVRDPMPTMGRTLCAIEPGIDPWNLFASEAEELALLAAASIRAISPLPPRDGPP